MDKGRDPLPSASLPLSSLFFLFLPLPGGSQAEGWGGREPLALGSGEESVFPVVVLLPGAWALAMTLPLEQRRASSSSPKSQSTHLPLPQTHVAWGCRLWQFSV